MRTALVAFLLLAPLALAQAPSQPVPAPDGGAVAALIDKAAGDVAVPAIAMLYNLTGQNITREDVRIWVDLNFTKGDVGLGGMLIGSGKVEVQADIHARVEMRVISSDRIAKLLGASAGYNMTAHNTTFLQQLYLPAEVFRASAAAETMAAFQRAEQDYLVDYLEGSVPELQVLGLSLKWGHTLPFEALTDTSLTEPPITLDLNLVVQYIRIESVPSLLHQYLATKADPSSSHKQAYIDKLKGTSGESLVSRDFFAAAAYTQLLNLSVQPGWQLDMNLHVPRGYEFTYFNDAVERVSSREANLKVSGLSDNHQQQKVFLASITQPKAVALCLFGALWGVGLLVAFPGRFAYMRIRMPRFGRPRPRP